MGNLRTVALHLRARNYPGIERVDAGRRDQRAKKLACYSRAGEIPSSGTGDAGIPTRWWGKKVPAARGEWERATCRALGFSLVVVPAVCERSRLMPMRSCRAVPSRPREHGQRTSHSQRAQATTRTRSRSRSASRRQSATVLAGVLTVFPPYGHASPRRPGHDRRSTHCRSPRCHPAGACGDERRTPRFTPRGTAGETRRRASRA